MWSGDSVSTNSTTVYYDNLAQGGVRGGAARGELRQLHNRFKRWVIDEALAGCPVQYHYILDLGCGRGGDLWKYRDNANVRSYVGVDNSSESIEEASRRWRGRKRHPRRRTDLRVTFVRADALQAPWCGGHPPTIVSMMFCAQYMLSSERAAAQLAQRIVECGARRVAMVIPDETRVLSAMGTHSAVGRVGRTRDQYSEGVWGQTCSFSLFAVDGGVREVDEYVVPWSELQRVWAAEGICVLCTELFRAPQLPPDERLFSELYRWVVWDVRLL
jgi:SAM-dependent methyltransferase